jgi:formate dehydrogenase subunit gamma
VTTPAEDIAEVRRHDALFRVFHWLIFAEGTILTLSGMQLGGILPLAIFPADALTLHIYVGIAFVATSVLYALRIISSGDYSWVGLRRIPYSLRYIISETEGWFGMAPGPADPMLYDEEKGRYAEKIIPSVIVVFWAFIALGAILALTGLALAYPQEFSFIYAITNPIGEALTGVTGLAYMLAMHRLIMYVLVALVAMHIYSCFVFRLVGSMITGKRNEKVIPTSEELYDWLYPDQKP